MAKQTNFVIHNGLYEVVVKNSPYKIKLEHSVLVKTFVINWSNGSVLEPLAGSKTIEVGVLHYTIA